MSVKVHCIREQTTFLVTARFQRADKAQLDAEREKRGWSICQFRGALRENLEDYLPLSDPKGGSQQAWLILCELEFRFGDYEIRVRLDSGSTQLTAKRPTVRRLRFMDLESDSNAVWIDDSTLETIVGTGLDQEVKKRLLNTLLENLPETVRMMINADPSRVSFTRPFHTAKTELIDYSDRIG